MKKQSGFTLIELAIVLVIIGLLLGGVLKGQELINSAKVKNMASDFKNVQVYIYGYQDKYKALPGDDIAAVSHLGAGIAPGNGNGLIGGNWDSVTTTDESFLFWQHVRLAGLAPGPTTFTDVAAYTPKNADGGRVGIQSISGTANLPTNPTRINGAYAVCSGGILGKFAKQLDTTLDDGATETGSMRVYESAGAAWLPTTGAGAIDDSTPYNVCMSF